MAEFLGVCNLFLSELEVAYLRNDVASDPCSMITQKYCKQTYGNCFHFAGTPATNELKNISP